ncbi:hypothetical protein EJ04DRAFT_523065 [Polyplosphaeria fusca]|uniref:Uncharacterized protein n=1 Tax=Polyplosphaeria fusca TaxID=682080 RepID=A0A9P4R1J7_9PLEO|nr:hypothetical protein EJ04DRAFT_523065 [Polyplosphaeria fusca]
MVRTSSDAYVTNAESGARAVERGVVHTTRDAGRGKFPLLADPPSRQTDGMDQMHGAWRPVFESKYERRAGPRSSEWRSFSGPCRRGECECECAALECAGQAPPRRGAPSTMSGCGTSRPRVLASSLPWAMGNGQWATAIGTLQQGVAIS